MSKENAPIRHISVPDIIKQLVEDPTAEFLMISYRRRGPDNHEVDTSFKLLPGDANDPEGSKPGDKLIEALINNAMNSSDPALQIAICKWMMFIGENALASIEHYLKHKSQNN